jgi:hypothetical protein
VDLAAAGATVSPSSLSDDVAWLDAPLPRALPARGTIPDDFDRLVAEHGPGPLGGVLRLLPTGSDLPRPVPKALAGPNPAVPWGAFASGPVPHRRGQQHISARHTAHCPPGFIPPEDTRTREMEPSW